MNEKFIMILNHQGFRKFLFLPFEYLFIKLHEGFVCKRTHLGEEFITFVQTLIRLHSLHCSTVEQ